MNFERFNGIFTLTASSRTSQRIQSLNKTVCVIFKTLYCIAMSKRMRKYSGVVAWIEHISAVANWVYPSVMTPKNILLGFSFTGTCSYINDVFQNDKLSLSKVTDGKNGNRRAI